MNPQQEQILMEVHERTIRIDERLAVAVEVQGDQEKRIRGLEKFKNWVLGILGLGAAAGGGTGIHNSL